MNNVLTRNEILDQYDTLPLEYQFFLNGIFVFSGTDVFGASVSIYVSLAGMEFVPAFGVAIIKEFKHLTKVDLKFLVLSDKLEVLYRD